MPFDLGLALGHVERALIAFGQSRGVNVASWFEANRNRIQALAQLLVPTLRRQSLRAGDEARQAQQALETTAALVSARLPREEAWFIKFTPLLQQVSEAIVRLQLAEVADAAQTDARRQPTERRTTTAPPRTDEASEWSLDVSNESSQELEDEIDRLVALAEAGSTELKEQVANTLDAWGFPREDAGYIASLDAPALRENLELLVDRHNKGLTQQRTAIARVLDRSEILAEALAYDWTNLSAEDVIRLLRKASRDLYRSTAFLVALAHRRPDWSAAVTTHIDSRGVLLLSGAQVRLPDGSMAAIEVLPPEDATLLRAQQAADGLVLRPVRETEAQDDRARTDLPIDLRSVAERTRANIEAIQIVSRGGAVLPEELAKVALYSGFGGLKLAPLRDQIPPEWMPEERGLIHEYYTPSVVARAIGQALLQFLPGLLDESGRIQALEPSAGIGRLIAGLSGTGYDSKIRWRACEYSRISAAILGALRPDIELFQGPFEEWIAAHPEVQGELSLVVSNPPYGVRGRSTYADPDKSYREKSAYLYFLRRCADLLKPGGIGVFLIPSGFMTGSTPRFLDARRRVLSRHHLMAAFRLPSEDEEGKTLFPGALLVTDLVFLRARGGELASIPPEDERIVGGHYFEDNPAAILGREVGRAGDEDDTTTKPRWGYQVRGTFERLPAFDERPMCRDCPVTPFAKKRIAKSSVILPDPVRDALSLAKRCSQYLSEYSRPDDPDAMRRAALLQPELKESVLAWHAQPAEDKLGVAGYLKAVPELQTLYAVMEGGKLLQALEQAPTYQPRYVGGRADVGAQAAFLWGQQRALSIAELVRFHNELGGSSNEQELREAVVRAGWCIDGESLEPEEAYYTGALWPKYDRARLAAAAGDSAASLQAERLLQKIAPATFADMQVEPRLGWLPLPTVEAWLNYHLKKLYRERETFELERLPSGLLTLKGIPYEEVANASRELMELLGYLNHDLTFFRPKVERSRDEDLEKKRLEQAERYRESFQEWIESNAEHQSAVLDAFNRLFRGWNHPTYSTTPVEIPRWNLKFPLYDYQNAGVRRLDANHGGGCFFDVGLGKTRTLCATMALAKQQGRARRPVFVVPGSVVYNWVAELSRVLPDYRVVVIGSKQVIVQRGARKGQVKSETDSPAERAEKWQKFKAGLYDVAIVTYSILARTRLRMEGCLEVIRSTPAVLREIGLQVRAAELRIRSLVKASRGKGLNEKQEAEIETLRAKYGGKPATERKQAIYNELEEEFVAGMLALPAGQDFDPDIYWEDLGIDWLCFDEAHIGKNLFTVGAREGGEPRFLGAPQEGSDIAWQMFFRSAAVRKRNGGSGVHLADATPAKNSPLEFLSMLALIDGEVWERLGIADAEQYLTQYLKIELKLIQKTNLQIGTEPCVVGFQNLDQLRGVLFRYGEFRTAAQVGLKIPEPRVHTFDVDMDPRQEQKYEAYLSEYEQALRDSARVPEARTKALGLLMRMSLVAVHAELDDQHWTFASASQATDFSSPKLDKIAELISKRKECGHLVFIENIAAHYWLRELLVKAGVERDRIAILNGETAPNVLARQRIAEGFTSEDAIYDVVICNKIAEQGLNLQNRTCAIYHGDLPWEPATLQQRNGRGQRQGNRYDVIDIYYILSKRSMDMARFELIRGKRGWMSAILESAASETNNPAAQTELSPEQWLMYMSRNPEKTQQTLELQRAKTREEEHKRIVKLAWANVRAIAIRSRELRNADIYQRTKLNEEIGRIAEELQAVDGEVWPWKFIVPYLLHGPSLSFAPRNEGAVWQGSSYRRRDSSGKIVDGGIFGKIRYSPSLAIGYRELGRVSWTEEGLDGAFGIWSATRPADWQETGSWPSFTEELDESVKKWLWQIQFEGVWTLRDARLDLATDEFCDSLWQHYSGVILQALSNARTSYQAKVPVVSGGKLELGTGPFVGKDVLPFTEAGYQTFLLLAKQSQMKWADIDGLSAWWWGRQIPRDLLVEREAIQAA